MTPELRTFPSRRALAAALAEGVGDLLRAALATRGRAALAVPGGTTPGPFLTQLGRADLDWSRVTVTLTDERWVPPDDPRSNQRLLAETLLATAPAARFLPLWRGAPDPEDALDAIAADLAPHLPLDVCVLGMGEDMHTASLFPGAPGLAAALDPNGCAPVAAIRAPGAPEPRVTLTAPVLRAARRAFLLIHGAAKRAALDRALASASTAAAPVRTVLDAPRPAIVYHAD